MARKNICIIPARGGSKRLPKKNIVDFFGKPLLAYTIEAALGSKLFGNDIYVSSDAEEILAVARAYPGIQCVKRPQAISGDEATLEDACLHLLDSLPERQFELLALLMPNCPLRTSEDVVASHRQFCGADAQCMISVIDYHWLYPFWALQETNNRLTHFFGKQYLIDSKNLPQDVYCPSGAVWWVRVDNFRKEKKFYGAELMKYEIPFERGVDIDTHRNLALAKKFHPLVYPSKGERSEY